MSKDVNSYRPTSFSSKTVLGEPMATRGVVVSTNTDDESNDQSEDQRVIDVETFLKENPLPEEVANLICRLPSMCSRLTSPEYYDSLNMNEILTVARALKINTSQSGAISMKSRRSRERGLQTKAQILSAISEKFGEQWTTMYDIANEIRNSSRSLRRRKQNKSPIDSNYSFDTNETKLNGSHSEINRALSYIQTAVKLPTRDELIFLTDEEFDQAIRFYRATHSEIIDLDQLPGGTDITTLQQIVGTTRETTKALYSCYQKAMINKKFIDKIKEHQVAKTTTSPEFTHNFTTNQETESSDEH